MFWDPWNVLRVYHLAGYRSPVSLVSLGFLGESLAEICQEWKVTGRNRDYLKSWPRTSGGPRFQHCSTTTSHPKVSVMWKATCHFLIVQCYNRYLSSCAKQSEDHLSVKYRLWRAEPAELCSLAVNIVCSWPDMNITYLECCFFFFFLLCFCSTLLPNVQGWESLTDQIQRRQCLFSPSLPEVGPSLFTQKCGHSVGRCAAPAPLQLRVVAKLVI